MRIPAGVVEGLEALIGRLESLDSLGGGSIHSVYRCIAGGERYFVKCAPPGSTDVLAAEAACLDLLRAAGSGLRVPSVVGLEEGTDGSWLVLEWLEPSSDREFPLALARGLAHLHRPTSGSWGRDADGYIGSLAQSNRRHSRWWSFWWEERLLPQIRLGGDEFDSSAWREQLPAALERLLDPIDQEDVSLLHGDLWSGNVMSTGSGPAIFDPACYYGHREVDLAMTELFGGFDRSFYTAYDEVLPRLPGYDGRRAAYQLYYLLVHVNIFGRSYSASARTALARVLAA